METFCGVVTLTPLTVQPDLVFDQREEQSCFFSFSPKKSRGKGYGHRGYGHQGYGRRGYGHQGLV